MKHTTTAALMLSLIVANIYAQQRPVRMTFSGSKVATAINLGPNTRTDEAHLDGNGTLGPFTYRGLRTDETIPQSFGKCGDGSGLNLRVVAGAGGVFRFQDGSLLTVTITGGALCVDLDHIVAYLTETYQITGGTGRFNGAKGSLALQATLGAVVYDASNPPSPVLLTLTGDFEGTIVGVSPREERDDGRQ
jgi:hypothetical protein